MTARPLCSRHPAFAVGFCPICKMEAEKEAPAVTLAEFLLARIAEDEARLRKRDEYPSGRVHWPADCDYPGDEPHGLCTCTLHLQLLAGCEASRRIVQQARPVTRDSTGVYPRDVTYVYDVGVPWVLKLLALPYADHPDYRPEWKP